MRAFKDGIDKMLMIKPRTHIVWRTTRTSYLNVPLAYIPTCADSSRRSTRNWSMQSESEDRTDSAGTPINLLSNTNLDAGLELGLKRLDLFSTLVDTLVEIKAKHLTEAQATDLMKQNVVPKFLAVNKCADFVEDKGHEFGTKLPMADKLALIELLKTF